MRIRHGVSFGKVTLTLLIPPAATIPLLGPIHREARGAWSFYGEHMHAIANNIDLTFYHGGAPAVKVQNIRS